VLDLFSADSAEEIFEALDEDEDGDVSLEELKGYMRLRGAYSNQMIEDFFAGLDSDKDGCISLEEFKAGLANHGEKPSPLAVLMAMKPPAGGADVYEDILGPMAPCRVGTLPLILPLTSQVTFPLSADYSAACVLDCVWHVAMTACRECTACVCRISHGWFLPVLS
jgi:hypothetical protein